MRNILSTTALILAMTSAANAYAHDDSKGKGNHAFMEETLSKLPEQDATQFRNTMKQAYEKDQAQRDQAHKLHEEISGILTADKFDKSAYVAKSKQLEKLHDKMHADMTEAFATAVAQLPQDERATLAAGMHHKHHHHEAGTASPEAPAQ
jgi:uncharacterized membrane protein